MVLKNFGPLSLHTCCLNVFIIHSFVIFVKSCVCCVCMCFRLYITQIKATNVCSRHSCNFPFEMGILDLLFFYLYVLIFFLIRVKGTLETFSTAFEKLSGMIKIFFHLFFSKQHKVSTTLCPALPLMSFFHAHAHDILFVRHLPPISIIHTGCKNCVHIQVRECF